MRSVIRFETDAKSTTIDEILANHDWMIDGAPENPAERRKYWLKKIENASSQLILEAEENALASLRAAEHALVAEASDDSEESVIRKQRPRAISRRTASPSARYTLASCAGDRPRRSCSTR
jgi:hypothetical protein